MQRLVAVLATCACVVAAPPARGMPDHEGVELVVGDAARARIDQAFDRFDPNHAVHREERGRRFDEMGHALFERELAGEDLACSRQIFVEAKWLIRYTAWWDVADARLDELAQSLGNANQAFANHASPDDGLYGVCANEEFIRVEQTLETYFNLADEGERPAFLRPGSGWGRSPDRLVDYLNARLISDVGATGEDMRSRLGGLASILAATQRRDHVMELIRTTTRSEPLSPEAQRAVRDALLEFLDAWQDPVSGYWGAWYVDEDGSLFKTTDLSITYHIVHALKGEVRHWPEIIRTTMAIRDQAYPFGWLSNGRWNNHNNYDLARMFRYGWPFMTLQQQKDVRTLIQEMVDYAFAHGIQPDYDGFVMFPELSSSMGAELYFGVSFLDAAGYFSLHPWAGELQRPAPASEVCAALIAHAETLAADNYVQGARKKLARACAEHMPPGDAAAH